ncbi:CotH kinase family protein [Phosphitispora sp. TUW77]|uniref:CotH kinase family protein n=1 Tax=Phosphitispora sp. TUW77 TaxID=3152361 RepID=UPI003AB8DDCF
MDIKKWLIPIALFILFLAVLVINREENLQPVLTGLLENKSIYQDEPGDVKELYVTVLPAKYQNGFTFADLNQDVSNLDAIEVELKVICQEGKNGTPQPGFYGYGLTDGNGIMSLRGQSTRLAEQKSYKIELNKKAGLWQGFQVINLNKHPWDSTKIRNKLSFDLFKGIPGYTSLRTQFVHLYIKDLSKGDFQANYQDFGLFTHVENVDKDFLKTHGLDSKGNLYKAENFEFYRYPDQLKLKTAPTYQRRRFEEVFEIKGDDDHRKLIKMLDDLNNDLININDIIDKYFDRENYTTWLALNILLGNIDTNSRNFFLYSPSDNDKWYFLPWDYDKCWGYHYTKGDWQEGISNYWGVVLHRRFLQNKQNLDELTEKIESMADYLNRDRIEKLVEIYKPVSLHYLSTPPDSEYSRYSMDDVLADFQKIPGLVEYNRQQYYITLQKPMPVHMGQPVTTGSFVILKWGKSYDFQDDQIFYEVEISETPDFKKVLYKKDGIRESEHVVNNLPPGKYYWRLGIKDVQGNRQSAFDFFVDKDGMYYFGVQEFLI